jgi:D-serine dehydratase
MKIQEHTKESGTRLKLLAEDCQLPLMTLNHAALINNCRWMQDYADLAKVSMAPHGKTSMCPELFKMQIDHGAWGMTLANNYQVKIAYDCGIRKILMANQLVGKSNIQTIIQLLKHDSEFEFYCLVDNQDNVDQLNLQAAELNSPLQVLIEIAPAHGRAGLRSSREVIELAQYIKYSAPHIQLAGIECYEGVIHSCDPIPDVDKFLHHVTKISARVEELGLFEVERLILSGGGTVFFDRVADILGKVDLQKDYELLIRPGCYISHDSGIYDGFQKELKARDPLARQVAGDLQAAIEIICYVQSIPEKGLAILNIGKRDVSFDSGLPTPEKHFSTTQEKLHQLDQNWEIRDLNDQHAFMHFPKESTLTVGDIICCRISHPCLTFDKWPQIALINDDYEVINFIESRFEKINKFKGE